MENTAQFVRQHTFSKQHMLLLARMFHPEITLAHTRLIIQYNKSPTYKAPLSQPLSSYVIDSCDDPLVPFLLTVEIEIRRETYIGPYSLFQISVGYDATHDICVIREESIEMLF